MARPLSQAEVAHIVKTFGAAAYDSGYPVGLGVGVYQGRDVLVERGWGFADAAAQRPFTPDSLFAIASNTKVFTTNLLGQDVANRRIGLETRLGQLSEALGPIYTVGAQATVQDLADFTAGYPSTAPVCAEGEGVPGCMPNKRPTLQQYSPADFLSYFQHNAPKDYDAESPSPLTSEPGPYVYSDFETGLLGLILASPHRPIGSRTVNLWWERIANEVLAPLGMSSTFLYVPPDFPGRNVALGYQPAAAAVDIDKAGRIAAHVVISGVGFDEAHPPAVTVRGGYSSQGGLATATATVRDGGVRSVTISQTAPFAPNARVSLSASTPAKIAAEIRAIIENGEVVGFAVENGGKGYETAPDVVVEGGRRGGGKAATGRAHVKDGGVTAVDVLDPGSDYFEPLRLAIAPGNPVSDTRDGIVTAWAAAGGLSSTIDDMLKFLAAAVGARSVRGNQVPPAMTAGFQIAEQAYACQNPSAAGTPPIRCHLGSGLAWEIRPEVASRSEPFPKIVVKNGALTGFISQILLVPSRNLGVVVFVNARTYASDNGATPYKYMAVNLAYDILYSIIYRQDAAQ